MREAVFGIFVAVQTFVLFAQADRFEVLFWWTRETWLLVLLLWLKNLALAAAAGAAFTLLLNRARDLPDADNRKPASLLVALALVAVGAGITLRWVFPDEIPPGLWYDPPFEARALLQHPGEIPWIGGVPLHDDPVASGNRELVSYLYLHFYDAMFRLFGRGETGFLALSSVPGCLALAGAYWLAREAFGVSAALLGVTLVSLARWPLIFSRWSYTASALIALALLAAASALAALRTGRKSLAVLSGLFTGLSLHTHSSSWAVAAGLGLFSLLCFRRKEVRGLILSSWVAALLAFAPFGWGYLVHPENLGGRLRDVPAGTRISGAYGPRLSGPLAIPATLAYNAVEYTGILLFTRDPNPRNGLPGHASVTPLVGLTALAGLGLASVRRTRGDVALFLVILGSLAGGIFSNPGGAPNTIRTCVVVIPALLAAASLVIRALGVAESKGFTRAALGACGVAAFVLATETMPFLSRWPEDPFVRNSFCPTETQAARLVRTLRGSSIVLEPQALRYPFVFDVLSGPTDPRVPMRFVPRRSVAGLLSSPPVGRVLYLVRASSLSELRAAGWRCGRGIAPNDLDSQIVLASVEPAARPGESAPNVRPEPADVAGLGPSRVAGRPGQAIFVEPRKRDRGRRPEFRGERSELP
jgi:4-amino-4-deoxy-L-arabinose transferase-like glycosyltransferase